MWLLQLHINACPCRLLLQLNFSGCPQTEAPIEGLLDVLLSYAVSPPFETN